MSNDKGERLEVEVKEKLVLRCCRLGVLQSKEKRGRLRLRRCSKG